MRQLFFAVLAFASPSLWSCGQQAPAADAAPQSQAKEEGGQGQKRVVPEAKEAPAAPAAMPVAGAVPVDTAGDGSFVGTVDKAPFVPRYHFFLRGTMAVPDEPEALIFVQTDAPDLCQHLAQGTFPRGATAFATAIMQADGADFRLGTDYLAPAERGRQEVRHAISFFRRLNERCEITPEPVGAQAEKGSAVLRSLVDGKEASMDFHFTFDTGDVVSGSIRGPYCEAPALFANPMALMAEVDPEQCL